MAYGRMGKSTGTTEEKDIGGGQIMKTDCGPSRGEDTTNYNPTLKKGGASMGGGPDDLSHTISSGKVASIQK